ncbi:MAG: alpha/beta hydrolase [Pseudomonadota bacterium]
MSKFSDNFKFEQGGESHFFTARDGLKIHVRIYGKNLSGVPVICLPGLSRNGRDFDQIAREISSDGKEPRPVYCFDFRGRGLSAYDPDWNNYNILKEAEDVVDGLTAFDIEHGYFLATSRGGLVTFVLTAMRPGAIAATILNDIGPVIEGDGLTQIRLYLSRAPEPKNWAQAASIQQDLMAKAFGVLTDDDFEREAWCRYRDIDGAIRPDHDPNLTKTLTSLSLDKPLPSMWPQFEGLRNVPVLTVRGANSNLLSQKTVEEMGQRHPNFRAVIIDGQGHAPLLINNAINQPIHEFLRQLK